MCAGFATTERKTFAGKIVAGDQNFYENQWFCMMLKNVRTHHHLRA
jgi:hypothetical protein